MAAYLISYIYTLPDAPKEDIDQFKEYISDAVEYISAFAETLNAVSFQIHYDQEPCLKMEVYFFINIGRKRAENLNKLAKAIHDLICFKYPHGILRLGFSEFV